MSQNTEIAMKELEIEVVHAEKTKGWWSVALESKNGDDFDGNKDRSFMGALMKSLDAAREWKAQQKD
jgi:hypothetical protein